MKNVSSQFLAMVRDSAQLVEADLYTITLPSGQVLYFTSAQVNIVYNGNTYLAAETAGLGQVVVNGNFASNQGGTPFDTARTVGQSVTDGWTVGGLSSDHSVFVEPDNDVLIRLLGGSTIPANSSVGTSVQQASNRTVVPGAPFTLTATRSTSSNIALPAGVTVTLRTMVNWLGANGALVSQTIMDVTGNSAAQQTGNASGNVPATAYFAQVVLQALVTNSNGTPTTIGTSAQLPADMRWLDVSLQLYSTPGFHRGAWRQTRGLNVDELEVDILFDGFTRILGQTPGAFANAGGFDLATLRLDKALAPDWTNPVVNGVVNLFVGIIGEVQATSSKVSLTVSNNLLYLNQSFPRNYFLPQCNHALFDSGCGLSKAAFAIAGTVTETSTPTVAAFSTNLTQADGWFSLGFLVWNSGPNTGIECSVKLYYNSNGQVQLIYPLSVVPSAGDQFTIYPGCDKLQLTCSGKFNNLSRFRGFPYTPTPETLEVGGTGSVPPTPVGGGGGAGLHSVPRGPGGLKYNFSQQ